MAIKRYRAKLVPKVLKCKTFHGHPTNMEQKYEVCEKDVAAFIPQLQSGQIPFCYNHNEKDVVGRVVHAGRSPSDNALEIDYEIDTTTEKGKDMDQWISKGRMASVSLSHMWGTNQVKEVSACWIPARHGSNTYADVTDPSEVKLMQQMHFNSNSGRYERQPDPLNPIRVAASAEDEEQHTTDVFIFQLTEMMPIVNASAVSSPPQAAAVAPSSPSAALPSPPVPAEVPAGSGLGLAPMEVEEEKKQQQPAAPVGSQQPSTVGSSFDFVKNKFMYGNGPWRKEEQATVLESLATEALEKAKAIKEANEAKAKLAAFVAQQEARNKEIEEEVRKKQDALNESLKTKVADALEGLDPELPMKARIQASLATATQKELEAFDIDIQSVLKVQASRPMQFQVQAERRFHEWQAQQYPSNARGGSVTIPSAVGATPLVQASSKSAPASDQLVNASAPDHFRTDIAAARKQPRGVSADPVRASAMRRARAFNGRGALSEYASFEDGSNKAVEWQSGAGANFPHDKIIANMTQGTMEAYFNVLDHSQPEDGTGGKMIVQASNYERPEVVASFCRFLKSNPQMMRVNQYDDDFASTIED